MGYLEVSGITLLQLERIITQNATIYFFCILFAHNFAFANIFLHLHCINTKAMMAHTFFYNYYYFFFSNS
jgi:hypothetical protein